jgi:hypothetical protein
VQLLKQIRYSQAGTTPDKSGQAVTATQNISTKKAHFIQVSLKDLQFIKTDYLRRIIFFVDIKLSA